MLLQNTDQSLQLKTITPEHLSPLWQISHGPAADLAWRAWDGPYFEDPVLTWEAFLEKRGPKITAHPHHAGIWYQGKLVGEVSAYFEDGHLERWLEFGLALYDQRLWNSGLGTAACQLWLTYLFKLHPELPRVGFTTWSGNFAMMRLGEKLGMEKEAQIRKVRFWQGQYYDSIKYGVLREEWEN
ncbi:GNAT family protein [Enterococcus asini]|uniref:GNAT family N-acetyltransferase n=1 Tax=Enterococcus asini TaxID=57732 RepID=UPI001E31462E|nr:GNAT family protein [Enterococcus asini]MCD5029797.1 GNAT family N-acetyltransferase [Enterococcus asini]MDT2784810.1 GNAT family protein [Enterococcus asini]